jgi:hypothetical protein
MRTSARDVHDGGLTYIPSKAAAQNGRGRPKSRIIRVVGKVLK